MKRVVAFLVLAIAVAGCGGAESFSTGECEVTRSDDSYGGTWVSWRVSISNEQPTTTRFYVEVDLFHLDERIGSDYATTDSIRYGGATDVVTGSKRFSAYWLTDRYWQCEVARVRPS